MKKILLVLLIFSLPLSVTGVELSELLLKSVGGPDALVTLRNLKSVKSVGTVTLNGEKGEFIQYFSPPDKYYLEVRFANFSLVQAHDGETAWQMNLNGQVSHLQGFAKQDLMESIYFESFGFLFSDSLENETAYTGLKEIDGQTYHEVAFFPFKTDTLYGYFDTTSGLRAYTKASIDQIEALTFVSDYRDISGLLIPFYSRADIAAAGLTTEIRLDTVVMNEPVPTGVFSPPLERKQDYAFPAVADRVTLPIRYVNGHVRLPVTINGRTTVWMILDSGASTNFLNSSAVADLFLSVVGNLPAMGIGGFEEVSLVQTDSLEVGDLTLFGQVAGRMDLDMLAKPIDSGRFGGILGYDFLSRFPVEVDYANATLTVYNPETFVADTGGYEIPFHLSMQIPIISGEINGIGGEFVVDLGSSMGLVLHRHFVKKHDLEYKLDDIRDLGGQMGGIGDTVGGRTAFAASFRMGEVGLQSIRVLLADSARGMAGSEDLAGNIGNLVLENFRVLFDYAGSRLILYRDESEN